MSFMIMMFTGLTVHVEEMGGRKHRTRRATLRHCVWPRPIVSAGFFFSLSNFVHTIPDP